MPDDTTAQGDAQGATPGQSQGDAPPAQGATPPTQGAGDDSGGATVEALTARISTLERENRTYRQQIRSAREQQDTGEVERLTGRVADLERELVDQRVQRQEQSLRLAALTEAQRLGFRNPDLAYRLMDHSAVEYAEDGAPRNVGRLLGELAKTDSYLLGTTDFGGGARSSAQGADMNALIRRAAGRT